MGYNAIMKKPIHMKFKLRDMEAWTKKSLGITLETCRGDVSRYVQMAEDFPPFHFQRIMRPLIVDEGVEVDDFIFTIVDEETGEEYHYNPHPFLHAVFDRLANPPKPSETGGSA